MLLESDKMGRPTRIVSRSSASISRRRPGKGYQTYGKRPRDTSALMLVDVAVKLSICDVRKRIRLPVFGKWSLIREPRDLSPEIWEILSICRNQ